MVPIRFICLVFLFVLSCSQWRLCLYVVHSCLPIRFICLVFLFVLSCSQWSLCLCVVHSCLPIRFICLVFLFVLSCSQPLGTRQNKEKHQTNKPNGQTRMDNTETQAPLGTRQNKEKHQTNKPRGKLEWTTQRHVQALLPMEPVSLCCPFIFAPRFICLVFLFVLSCSQWSLCLYVVHSCLPIRFICLMDNPETRTGTIGNKTEQREIPSK
jgi:hypothetical protein